MNPAGGELAASLAHRLRVLGRRVEEAGDDLDRLERRAVADASPAARSAAEEVLAGRLGELQVASAPPLASLEGIVLRLLRLGCTRGPVAERAAGLLARSQAADGGFGSGAEPLRLRRTAHLAAWLASNRHARPSVLARASAFVAAAWSPARVAGGSAADLAAWAHFFSHAAGDEALELADAALAWCGRELDRSFRAGRLTPSEAARVLAFCDAVAIPGGSVHAEAVLRALAGESPGAPGVADALAETWALRRLADLLHLPPSGGAGR